LEDLMPVSNRKLAWYAAGVLIISFAVVTMAQDKSEAANVGSLAALTAEVRQLRLAVEESTRTQSQTQALGVYLSVQQSRLVQVTARLDTARKELDDITVRSKVFAADLSRINETLLRETNPQVRAGLESEGQAAKQELERLGIQDQQVRSREAELSQMLQAETTRWTDLISTLERLIKK
jgi:hypothetical protein